MGEIIEFQSDGRPARGYLALPPKGQGPGVLVLHAWWGLNLFFQKLCDRLSAKGFTAFAPDLYGGRVASTVDEAKQLIEAMDFQETRSIAIQAIALLKERSSGERLGTIGFSMGSAWAIFLSCLQPEDFNAVVIFYGSETADFTRSQSVYLGHFAESDVWEPLDGIRQMEENMNAAQCQTDFHIYPDVAHWFFETDRPEHNRQAAKLAWDRTLSFLTSQLKPPIQGTGSAAVLNRTGKRWDEWFTLLDQAGAADMTHAEIARFLEKTYPLSGWWCQHITVHYERARGRRSLHEMPNGYQISRSRTFSVPVARLFQTWHNNNQRDDWLGRYPLSVRKTVDNKTLYLDWLDSKLEVRFTPKGESKSQVNIQQSHLPNSDQADSMKLFWTEALNRLEKFLLAE